METTPCRMFPFIRSKTAQSKNTELTVNGSSSSSALYKSNFNLGTILCAAAQDSPQKTAIVYDDKIFLSYKDLDVAARKFASLLMTGNYAKGAVPCRPEDRVAILLPNIPQFCIAYYGALYAGCIVVPMNFLFTEREITGLVKDSEAKVLVALKAYGTEPTKAAKKLGIPILWADDESSCGMQALLSSANPLPALIPTSPDDTAVILYTSGTTGVPKGAMLSHMNLFLNATIVPNTIRPVEPDEETIVLAVLPLFHIFGQTCMQNTTFARMGKLVMLPRFEPGEVLRTIEKYNVSLFAGVPTMYIAMLRCPESDKYSLGSLKMAISGGAAIPVEILKEFEQRYGIAIMEGYGLSETSPTCCSNSVRQGRKPGSIGHPVWGVEMTILDEKDQPVPDGQPGEVCIRGHCVMKGYFKRPKETAEAMRNGWFHTGDVGIRDPDGSYRIVDRTKDMIIRGGLNVYPREVEEVLYMHPAVAEAAVVGIPNERLGEEIAAYICKKEGHEVSSEEITEHCKRYLAAYKYPRKIEFVKELPKGPSGKILKREIREWHKKMKSKL
ncbi:hypothetical protein GpartN1_g833.t1 [Galdieria partita]|uniref:Long-chain-fatty-acid--CoA ligase n=1 Tax=Galdieria partita TaxID=83374 RepID=A0A9C7PSV4_9RHOD|nr:hypothetical protein GpartN1_g833.t1 [Galdieria partita]